MTRLTQSGHRLPDRTGVHGKLWNKLINGLSVWIVNARTLRSVFDDEFASGGLDHVYERSAEKQAWTDNTLWSAEHPYALFSHTR